MRARVAVSAAAIVLAVALTGTVAAGAQQERERGPTITLDRSEAAVGEPVIVTMRGFTSNQITAAVCGNLAKRGSADCNMPAAQSERIRDDEVTLTQLFAQEPPVPCPCLVRVFSPTSPEFAVAPITLVGHPVAEVADIGIEPLLELDVHAEAGGGGVLDAVRAQLGGRAIYDVTVSVRNRTTVPLSSLRLSGVASRRFDDDAATIPIEAPTSIDPGRTWTATYQVELPSPAIGQYQWRVVASGVGSTVQASTAVSRRPVLLLFLLSVLVVDVVLIVRRFVQRHHARVRHVELEPLA